MQIRPQGVKEHQLTAQIVPVAKRPKRENASNFARKEEQKVALVPAAALEAVLRVAERFMIALCGGTFAQERP